MIRAGVVGAGMVFSHYARAAAEVPEIQFTAIYDPDPARPRTHDSMDAMLDEPLDAVLVLAPNDVHVPAVRACLDRRIPVLCEKPLAHTAGAARALVAAAARCETPLLAAMHARFRPEIRWFHEHLDGPVARFTQTWLEDWTNAPAWYSRASSSGGGVLLDVGINHIDWMANHVPSLAIASAGAVWEGEVETECAIRWMFDGGDGETHLSWRGSPEARFSIIETKEGGRFELLHQQNAAYHDGRMYGPWRNDEYAWVLRALVDAVHDPASVDASQAIHALELVDCVYEHLRGRERVARRRFS